MIVVAWHEDGHEKRREFADEQVWRADAEATFHRGEGHVVRVSQTGPIEPHRITCVGTDGQSRPMYRYSEDLALPEHMRRIVSPDHHPIAS